MGARNRGNGLAWVETEVEVDIDEHLQYATDDALLLEVVERGLSLEDDKSSFEELGDLLCAKLDIIKAQELRGILADFIP